MTMIKVTNLWVDGAGNVFAEGQECPLSNNHTEVPLGLVVGAGVIGRVVNTAVELLSHFTEEQLRTIREAGKKQQEQEPRAVDNVMKMFSSSVQFTPEQVRRIEQAIASCPHGHDKWTASCSTYPSGVCSCNCDYCRAERRAYSDRLVREAGHNALAVQAPIRSAAFDTEKAREYYRKVGLDPAKVGEDWSALMVYQIFEMPHKDFVATERDIRALAETPLIPPTPQFDPPGMVVRKVCPQCKGKGRIETGDLSDRHEVVCGVCHGTREVDLPSGPIPQPHPTQSSGPPDSIEAAVLQGMSTANLPKCGAGHDKPSGLRVKCVLERGHDGPHRSGPDYQWE